MVGEAFVEPAQQCYSTASATPCFDSWSISTELSVVTHRDATSRSGVKGHIASAPVTLL